MIVNPLPDGPIPLNVRLKKDFSKLPAGISIQFPRDIALALILHKHALPVGNQWAQPDLIIDQESLDENLAGDEFLNLAVA